MVDFVTPQRLPAPPTPSCSCADTPAPLLPGTDAAGPRVIDVTGFPDTAALLAAADALVTDYSSVMFDFAITGKPMYFLVPDLEHYRGELRGFYFDLLDLAPGPVVRSQADLERALAEVDRRSSPSGTRVFARCSLRGTTGGRRSVWLRGCWTRGSCRAGDARWPRREVAEFVEATGGLRDVRWLSLSKPPGRA